MTVRPQGSSKQGEVHPVECEKHDCFIVLVRPSIIFSLFGEALPGSDMSRSLWSPLCPGCKIAFGELFVKAKQLQRSSGSTCINMTFCMGGLFRGCCCWLRKACVLAKIIPVWSSPLSFTSTVKLVTSCNLCCRLDATQLLMGTWRGDGGKDPISACWPGSLASKTKLSFTELYVTAKLGSACPAACPPAGAA